MKDLSIFNELKDQLGIAIDWPRFRKSISGTYKNANPASDNSVLELRVDVDATRPQDMMSGDMFSRRSWHFFHDFQLDRSLELSNVLQWPIFFTVMNIHL